MNLVGCGKWENWRLTRDGSSNQLLLFVTVTSCKRVLQEERWPTDAFLSSFSQVSTERKREENWLRRKRWRRWRRKAGRRERELRNERERRGFTHYSSQPPSHCSLSAVGCQLQGWRGWKSIAISYYSLINWKKERKISKLIVRDQQSKQKLLIWALMSDGAFF